MKFVANGKSLLPKSDYFCLIRKSPKYKITNSKILHAARREIKLTYASSCYVSCEIVQLLWKQILQEYGKVNICQMRAQRIAYKAKCSK